MLWDTLPIQKPFLLERYECEEQTNVLQEVEFHDEQRGPESQEGQSGWQISNSFLESLKKSALDEIR